MNKFLVLSGGLLAAGSAALVCAGIAMSQPGVDTNSANVVGEQYGKALSILKSEGMKGYFGGSFGSVLPQAECLVDSQKTTSQHRILLELDCSQKAADEIKAQGPSSGGGGPTVGSNGITTVTPTPVVPIQGAPGAGTPMPPPAG